MNVDILAIGSRGDVQPYLALGIALQAAGYRVRLVTLGGFEELIAGRGPEHLVIGDSPQQLAKSEAGRDWVDKREKPADFVRGFARLAVSLIEQGIRNYWKNIGNPEAILASPMGLLVGTHVAEKLQIPLVKAQLAPPILPTRYDFNGRSNLGVIARANWTVILDATFHSLGWMKLRSVTNAARTSVLGLPDLPFTRPIHTAGGKPLPLLGGYSPSVAPKLPDWGDWVQVTGYWFLEDPPDWTPPEDLVDFLKSGSPPVFIGFGSTPFPDPDAATRLITRAVARAGHRCVLVTGQTGLPSSQQDYRVLSIPSVSHGWLLPRVCAAVHQGGAGVTGAVLRAGLPAVVVPVFADQPFWGDRVFQLGAGPRPIPAKRLTEDALTTAIQATADEGMRSKAAALGERIRREDGLGCAVSIIGTLLDHQKLAAKQHYAG